MSKEDEARYLGTCCLWRGFFQNATFMSEPIDLRRETATSSASIMNQILPNEEERLGDRGYK